MATFKLALTLFCSFWLLAAPSAQAQGHDLGEGYRLSHSDLQKLKDRLPKTSSESVFYHWTSFTNYVRWLHQGHIDAGEVAFFNRPSETLQVYGPGVYMAKSPDSSRNFGVAAVTFTMPAGISVMEESEVSQILGRHLSKKQLSKLGELFPSIRNINGDWYVANHPSLFSHVGDGDAQGAKIEWSTLERAKIEEQLFALSQQHPDARYLSKILSLFSYMDGVALYRAMKLNPGAPWSEFESHRFEQYWRGRMTLLGDSAHIGAIASSYSFGANAPKERWVAQQIDHVLPKIVQEISGQHFTSSTMIRSEGVRAGGNYDGENFLATDAELDVLKANKFVEVQSRPHPSGRGHLVHYFYPDALHYKKFEQLLSAPLRADLQAHTPDQLMQRTSVRQGLNQRIVRELLVHVFSQHHHTSVSYTETKNISFMQDLISIHPFGDFNGRSIRMYFELAYKAANLDAPIHALADLDLLTTPEKYKELLTLSSRTTQALKRAMLQEFVASLSQKRMAAYRDLPAWQGIWESLAPVGGQREVTFDHADYELIRLRRFVELFEKKFTSYQVSAGANCRTVFNP